MSPRVNTRFEDDELPVFLGLQESRFSQSLERGLAILEGFTPERPWLGITDIADPLGMSRSTTHRYVMTLAALGFLVQGANRKYRLSVRVTDLGMSTLNSTGLREHSRPYLEELRRRTTYTASLAMLDGPEILYVDRAPSFRRGQNKIDLGLRPGSRLPAYCTSMGKVLLANLPESEQRDLIDKITLTRRGPNSIVSKKALRSELKLVLDEGVAVNDEELGVPRTQKEGRCRRSGRLMRCCAGDGGRSSGVALQGVASNHRELRRLRAGVVSVADKACLECVRCDPGRRT